MCLIFGFDLILKNVYNFDIFFNMNGIERFNNEVFKY